MFPAQEVKSLKQQGKFEDAWTIVDRALRAGELDPYLARSAYWLAYDAIKIRVAAISSREDKTPAPQERKAIGVWSLRIAQLDWPAPSEEFSRFIWLFKDLGGQFPGLVGIVSKRGIDCLRTGDYEPFKGEKFDAPSLAYRLARMMAKSAIDFGATGKFSVDTDFVRRYLEHVIETSNDGDKLKTWLHYDLSRLLLSHGQNETARAHVVQVLVKNQRAAWAWTVLSECYEPGSAEYLACCCQAVLSAHEPQFAKAAFVGLASHLAQQSDTKVASSLITTLARVYQREGWRIKDELESLMSEPWFDASVDQDAWVSFAKTHRGNPKKLLYVRQNRGPANWLGVVRIRDTENSLGLIALRIANEAVQISFIPDDFDLDHLNPGDPIEVTYADDGKGRHDVLEIEDRIGIAWDVLDNVDGIMEGATPSGDRGFVFAGRKKSISFRSRKSELPPIGSYVRVHTCKNPKRNQLEAYSAQRIEHADVPDVEVVTDVLKVHEKGFAFVGDRFVAPPLVTRDLDGELVTATCVYSYNKKKQTHTWKAIKVEVASENAHTQQP